MGREVRMVPANWQHPKDAIGNFIPLLDGDYALLSKQWDESREKWEHGEFPDYASAESRKLSYSEWDGARPKQEDYMPQWSDSERTHYMMYEDTSEGTPISPAFTTPEELARWLTDTNASSFGNSGASYEGWLRVCKGGFACSAVMVNGVMTNGVDGLTAMKPVTS